MLNYIKAELWKAFRHKGIYGLALFLGLCTALFTFMMLEADDFSQMASAASTTMLLGMLVAPLLTQIVDGKALGSLKNEVSFGLSRGRIYWGKLLAGLMLGLVLCLLLLGSYLLVGWLALPHYSREADLVALAVVGFSLLGALPVWCGIYSLCHMMALLIPSTAAWMAFYYILSFFGQPVLVALAAMGTEGRVGSLIQAILMPASLLMPDFLSGWLTWEYQFWCWAVGIGWLVFATALGLLWFRRREIK